MELLVIGLGRTNSNPAEDTGNPKLGDISEVYPDGTCTEQPAPLSEGGNVMVIVKVPTLTLDSVYAQEWQRRVQFDVVSSDLPTDVHRITISAVAGEYAPTSGVGKVTKTAVETYLNGWGATVVDFTDNAVTFDFGIYNAMKSERFWGRPTTDVTFQELNYNQSNGNHRISADYSATGVDSAQIAAIVTRAGATINSHNTETKVIVFTLSRATVRQAAQDDVARRLRTMLRRRKYRLNAAWVQALANGERWTTITPTEFASLVENKVNE